MSIIDQLDPQHRSLNLFANEFSQDIWEKRYRHKGKIPDNIIADTFRRTIKHVCANERADTKDTLYVLMLYGIFMPAGRILASAGVDGTNSTLQNCYVSRTVEDSVEGIMQAYNESMTTLARFGGIGIDFSPIRPKNAKIGTQGLVHPGVVHWMDMWHEGAEKIKQAGHRRGAMMGTLRCDHPDIYDFITAKNTPGRLTNFNISVLITDKFMDAVANDKEWPLVHRAHPAEGTYGISDDEQYIWCIVKARDLWEAIMRNTYEYAEPGVIFVDRINQQNNLAYCETINCTNPCGEQPLPPFGACNLGHINLGRLVSRPFTPEAMIDYELLDIAIKHAVLFLDNVIDVSNFPLPQQKEEQRTKRRIGLGISGLHDLLIQLGLTYGTPEAAIYTSRLMRYFAKRTYQHSIELAKTKGAFPAYVHGEYSQRPFVSSLSIKMPKYGIRNSVLLTVAPTGTVSSVYGNISSGVEPVFAHKMNRKVWVDNNNTETHLNESFISRFYRHCTGEDISTLECATTALQIPPNGHILMQAAVQKWIDASVTKTVNVPEDIAFKDFISVYEQAYDMGCKGCTTYRPSEVRGSVLEDASKVASSGGTPHRTPAAQIEESTQPEMRVTTDIAKRPEILMGCTYKIKWQHLEDNIFLTINERDGRPWECFLATRDLRNIEWMVVTMIQLSRALQRGADPIEEARILKRVQGAHEGAFMGKKYYTSLVSYIGELLERHFTKVCDQEGEGSTKFSGSERGVSSETPSTMTDAATCPKCFSTYLIYQEGCMKCGSCDYSKCG